MNPLDNIKFVLVNTSHPGNIGAAARAIKTMGIHRLCLVSPEKFPANEATWRAAGGKEVLEAAEVVETLDDAVASCNLVYATSARQRYVPWPLQSVAEAAETIVAHAHTPEARIAVVFGREDRGLTNEELQKCNAHLTIPAAADYGVLNIAAAVQVVAYEIHAKSLGQQSIDAPWDVPAASIDDVERLYTHLLDVMQDVKFYDDENPKQMPVRIKRLLMRSKLDRMEVNMLRGFLRLTQRQLGTEDSNNT